MLLLIGNQHSKRGLWIPKSGKLSYLPCPANPLPDTKVHKDPGDGQCYCQRHSNLAWFFQAIGHFMHVAPVKSEQATRRLLYTQGNKHAAEEAVMYHGDACRIL